MSDDARLRIEVDAQPVAKAGVSLKQLEEAAKKAEAATSNLEAGTRKTGVSIAEFAAKASKAAGTTGDLKAQTDSMVRSMGGAQALLAKAQGAHIASANAARLQSYELVNLGRQMSDVATMAALGAGPFQILASQGLQVADVFVQARSRGVGLVDAFRQIAGGAVSTATRFAPLIAGGAAFAGLAYGVAAVADEMRKTAEAARALEASTAAARTEIDVARDAMQRASAGTKILQEDTFGAALGIKSFAGEIGDAAAKLYDFAAAAKTASVNALLAKQATLRSNLTDLERRLPEQRRRDPFGYKGSISKEVDAGFGYLAGEIANLYTGGESDDRLRAQVNAARAALEDLKRTTKDVMGADLAGWADEGRAAMTGLSGSTNLAKTNLEAATAAALAFIANLKGQREVVGTTDADLRALEVRRAAAAAPTATLAEQIRANARALTEEAQAAAAAAYALEQRDEQTRKRLMANWTGQFADVVAGTTVTDFQSLPWAPDLETATDRLLNAYDQTSNVLFDMAGSLRAGDWSGFVRAMGSFKDILKGWKSQSTEGKIGSIASLMQGAGQMIGGKGGAALMGAGMGAGAAVAGLAGASQLGLLSVAAVTGPVGWAVAGIGALAGAIFGLSGASKAAKKAEEERRKAIEDLNRAATKQGFDIWIERLKLMGQATAAQTITREQEMLGVDPRNQEAMGELYKLQDARAQQDMQLRLLQAQGKAAEALAITRRRELDVTTDALKPILQLIYAAEDAASALAIDQATYAASIERVTEAQSRANEVYRASVAEIEQTRDKFKGLADTLRSAREGLTGAAGSSDAFWSTASAARLGDTDAMARLAGLAGPQADLIRSTARNSLEEARGIAAIAGALGAAEATATRQVSAAERQLEELRRLGEGWVTLDATTATGLEAVRAEIANLSAAFGLKAAAAPGAMGFYGVPENKDVNMALERATGYSGGFGQGGFQAYITSDAGAAYRDEARRILESYGQGNRIQGFASGGVHTGGARIVGERGPELEITGPSRIYSASQTKAMLRSDNSDVVAAINRLEERMARIEKSAHQTERNTRSTKDVLEASAYGHNPLTTVAA